MDRATAQRRLPDLALVLGVLAGCAPVSKIPTGEGAPACTAEQVTWQGEDGTEVDLSAVFLSPSRRGYKLLESPGTLRLGPGEYWASVRFSAAEGEVAVIGCGSEETILHGSKDPYAGPALHSEAAALSVEGLTLDGEDIRDARPLGGSEGVHVALRGVRIQHYITSGVLVAPPGGTLTVESSEITEITDTLSVEVYETGSAPGASARFIDTVFSSNTTELAPWRCDQESTAVFDRVTFEDNVGYGEAGAIYASSTCSLTVRDSDFRDNRSGAAGAIWSDGADTLIEGSTFSGNTGGLDGAAVMVSGGMMSCAGLSFSDNSPADLTDGHDCTD